MSMRSSVCVTGLSSGRWRPGSEDRARAAGSSPASAVERSRLGVGAAMRISAKVDDAVRAAVQLAAAAADTDRRTKGDAIARAQGIPVKVLEDILSDLRHAGLLRSQRGAEGGCGLGARGDALRRLPAARRPRTALRGEGEPVAGAFLRGVGGRGPSSAAPGGIFRPTIVRGPAW